MSPKHTAQSSASRRKSTKRLLVHSDDDDEQRTKRVRTTDTDASLSAPDDDVDMDIDDDDDDAASHEPSPSHKQRKRKGMWVKKPHISHSEDEESDRDIVEDDLSDIAPPAEHSDDDFELGTPPRRKAKAGPSKGKTGKTKPGQPKAKAKSVKDKDREVHMKDERKLASTPHASAQSQPLDLFSNDDPTADTLDATKDQAIPKKRKLPPIRKTKTAGATSIQTPSTTSQKPAPPTAQESAKSLPASEQRKQISTGARDVDLGDERVYAELFKGAGGNTPRSGVKNAEERRKELDRMRDEARARRNEEAKYTFDLQSQADKIAGFERRLRADNSTVLHPNFLAAKFRDEWELDRRNRRSTPKEEGEA